MTRVAVVTVAHGRHDHLLRQRAALARSTVQPTVHVVVAMDDPDLHGLVPDAHVVEMDRVDGHLPLAAARNAGVRAAGDVDLLVLLDVDCLPAPRTLARYAAAAGSHEGLLLGPVAYLPPPPAGGYPDDVSALGRPHPARPVPTETEVLPALDPDLFWSLSFACTPTAWGQVGGFCEDYVGYGGEDTDFGRRAQAAGVPSWWVGGAWAFHQHHAPGRAAVADVVRNAGVFFDRWGWWPMSGWLQDYQEQGLAHRGPEGRWQLTGSGGVGA